MIDKLVVNIGLEILKLVLGCILIEVDVCFFYDIEVLIVKVKCLIKFYNDVGISNDCILIKLVFIW